MAVRAGIEVRAMIKAVSCRQRYVKTIYDTPLRAHVVIADFVALIAEVVDWVVRYSHEMH
jgi:hypothetical protein